MALNNCGPIAIGGCTSGVSIAKELGLTTTAQHSLNCTSYRALSGQASGAVSMNAFHGKSNVTYLCISTVGATVVTCGNYKIAQWTGSGNFTVHSLGSASGYGNHINWFTSGGGGGGAGGGYGGGGGGTAKYCAACLSSGGLAVCTLSCGFYTVTVAAGGARNGFAGGYTAICHRGTTGYACGGKGGSCYNGGKNGCCLSRGGYGAVQSGCCCVRLFGGGGGGTVGNGGCGSYPTAGNGGTGIYLPAIFAGAFGTQQYSGGGGGGGAAVGGVFVSGGFTTIASGGHGAYCGGFGTVVYCNGSPAIRQATNGGAISGSGGGGSTNCTRANNGGAGAGGRVYIRWRFQ